MSGAKIESGYVSLRSSTPESLADLSPAENADTETDESDDYSLLSGEEDSELELLLKPKAIANTSNGWSIFWRCFGCCAGREKAIKDSRAAIDRDRRSPSTHLL
jgi:hypothetical protein